MALMQLANGEIHKTATTLMSIPRFQSFTREQLGYFLALAFIGMGAKLLAVCEVPRTEASDDFKAMYDTAVNELQQADDNEHRG